MQKVIVILLLSLFTQMASAQISDEIITDESIDNTTVEKDKKEIKEKKFKPDNIFLGTTFYFMFGNAMYIDISPYGGYLLGDIVGLGVGGTYIYSALFTSAGMQSENNIFGLRAFANVRPFKKIRGLNGLYAHIEGEYLSRQAGVSRGKVVREWMPAVNVGLGYNSSFDKGFAFTAELLFNTLWISQVNQGAQPVFNSPWQYRLGLYYAF